MEGGEIVAGVYEKRNYFLFLKGKLRKRNAKLWETRKLKYTLLNEWSQLNWTRTRSCFIQIFMTIDKTKTRSGFQGLLGWTRPNGRALTIYNTVKLLCVITVYVYHFTQVKAWKYPVTRFYISRRLCCWYNSVGLLMSYVPPGRILIVEPSVVVRIGIYESFSVLL